MEQDSPQNPSSNSAASFAKVVSPGDTLTLNCPEGLAPKFKTGDLLPNGEAPAFFVSQVSGSEFIVGPLKPGTFNLEYECGEQGQKLTSSIEVVAISKEEMPNQSPPLLPVGFSFLWLWLSLLILLVLVGGALFWINKKKSATKKQAQELLKLQKSQKKDPTQLLKELLSWLEQVQKKPSNPDLKPQDLYQKGYRGIRGFLESELKLKTQAETTPQFIGSLRVISNSKNISSNLMHKIESLLILSEHNRFGAGFSDSTETRTHYASELHQVLSELQKLSQEWRMADLGNQARTTPPKPRKPQS